VDAIIMNMIMIIVNAIIMNKIIIVIIENVDNYEIVTARKAHHPS
jgi:hypothetical protein